MQIPVISAALIISIAIITALRLYLRSKERQSLIEKGLDPSLVNIYSNKNSRKIFLFTGILLLGIALGIITGILLAGLLKLHGETKEFILLSVIIFTALSSFVCYYLSRGKDG